MATATKRRHAVFHQLRVATVEPLTDDAVAIGFEVPPELADEFEFQAGQHVNIRTEGAGDDVRRSYSICSPAGSGLLRIAVKRLPGGAFSSYAATELRPGDTVEVMTPLGRFNTPLDPEHRKHYAFVAAGSGITPILSLVATVLRTEPHSRVTLLYGNRTSASVMFADELADLKDRYPERLHLIHVLSREAGEVELFNGRLDPDRLGRILDLLVSVDSVDEWFLCGPYGMVVGARDLLGDRGVERRRVHMELFHVGDVPTQPAEQAPADEDAAEVTVVLDGRRSVFPLREHGGSVLETALTVRSDAPFACKGGVCGTCRAKLVEGTVRMDTNWALEPDEIQAGYVLTCQSHPTSSKVVLDYDA